MSRRRFIALIVAAVLAISGALYLSAQRNLPRDTHGAALVPTLAGELNTVTVLSVRRGSAAPTVTVHQQAGKWTVAERADYPADVSKLRKLLLALSDAKIVEEKTSNPANFVGIGVEDPSSPAATGAEISVTARDGKHAVIIGKPVGEGNFARRTGDNRSYSVEPGISFETEPRFWIDSRLLDAAAAGIQRIEVKPAAGPAAIPCAESSRPPPVPALQPPQVRQYRGRQSGGSQGRRWFALDGVPPGRKAAESATLAPSPTAFSGLTADDVAPVGDVDFSKATVATVTLSDGNVITLTGAVVGDKHWIQLKASKDAALDAKTAGRAYDMAGYRFDAVFRPLDQLLVPKETPAAKKGSAATPAGDSSKHPAASKKQSPTPAS